MNDHDEPRDLFGNAAGMLKAMAHPLRLEILCGVRAAPCTQTYMAEVLGVPQSTIAQHLRVLRGIGLIRSERQGLEVTFSLADERTVPVLELLCGQGRCEEGHTWEELAAYESQRRASGAS
ncbi:MAG: winged helix-turn-helix transcriptional regulator [Chitinivibrionia bacterium]|nr:winged helix-turn-helix transcriptional regulator [Chitinivibrionia bacterium]